MNSKSQVVSSSSLKSQKPPSSRRVARRQRRQRARLGMSIAPAAIGANASSYATVKTRVDGSANLHVREIFPVKQSASGLCLAIPLCPTKWTGTRTAALAATYMSHRPLRVSWQYVPATSSNTAGSIAVGTVWSGCRLPTSDEVENMYQYLPSTNGGNLSSVWQPTKNAIACGRNLRANQFPLYEVSSDDIPFWIVVASAGEATIGSLVVTADFTLRNPITPGSSGPLSYSGNITFEAGQTETTFSLPQSAISGTAAVGQEIVFTPLKTLLNRSGGVLTSTLSSFIATVKEAGASLVFSVDPSYAAGSFRSVLIGRNANFR